MVAATTEVGWVSVVGMVAAVVKQLVVVGSVVSLVAKLVVVVTVVVVVGVVAGVAAALRFVCCGSGAPQKQLGGVSTRCWCTCSSWRSRLDTRRPSRRPRCSKS